MGRRRSPARIRNGTDQLISGRGRGDYANVNEPGLRVSVRKIESQVEIEIERPVGWWWWSGPRKRERIRNRQTKVRFIARG